MKRAALFAAVALSAISAFAQADASWTAPPDAAARKNPLASKSELSGGGLKVFSRNCVICHGSPSHRALTKAPDLSQAVTQSQSDGALFWKITNGNTRKGMPAWSSLPEPQRWQLVLYIRSLKQ